MRVFIYFLPNDKHDSTYLQNNYITKIITLKTLSDERYTKLVTFYCLEGMQIKHQCKKLNIREIGYK